MRRDTLRLWFCKWHEDPPPEEEKPLLQNIAYTFKKRAIARLRCVLFLADPDAVEVWSGLVTLAMGVLFLNPMITFQNPVYYLMAEMMPEPFWGTLLVAIGVVKLHAYFLGNLHSRRFCLFIMFITWMLMSVMVVAAWGRNPSSAAPIVFSSNALIIGWAFIRVGISQNTREVLLNGAK